MTEYIENFYCTVGLHKWNYDSISVTKEYTDYVIIGNPIDKIINYLSPAECLVQEGEQTCNLCGKKRVVKRKKYFLGNTWSEWKGGWKGVWKGVWKGK